MSFAGNKKTYAYALFITLCVQFLFSNAVSHCVHAQDETKEIVQIDFEIEYSNDEMFEYYVCVTCYQDRSALYAARDISDSEGRASVQLGPQDFNQIRIALYVNETMVCLGAIEMDVSLSTCPSKFKWTVPSETILPGDHFHFSQSLYSPSPNEQTYSTSPREGVLREEFVPSPGAPSLPEIPKPPKSPKRSRRFRLWR
jgi:hypothetical protein